MTNAALARAGIGALITLGPLALVRPTVTAAIILGGLGALFLIYGFLALVRGRSSVAIDARGIHITGPFPKTVAWDSLADVRLRYYTTRKDRSGGWMVLSVKGMGRRLRIESTLRDFSRLLARVIAEAERAGVELSPETRGNLGPFGIAVADGGEQGGMARWPTS